jgi:hypothetical protein
MAIVFTFGDVARADADMCFYRTLHEWGNTNEMKVRTRGTEEDHLSKHSQCSSRDVQVGSQSILSALRSSCKACQTSEEIKKSTLTMIKYVDAHPAMARCACFAAYLRCKVFGENCATCRAVCALVTNNGGSQTEETAGSAAFRSLYCGRKIQAGTCNSRRTLERLHQASSSL